MDHLNKQQIVLLVILASFVTAITTGIVTVSLTERGIDYSQNGGAGVVNTVNRVVERTIERVASGPATTTTVIKTENRTVIVGIDEILSNNVEKVLPSIVRVYDNTFGTSVFTGFGIIVDKNGTFISDKTILSNGSALAKYTAKYSDGKIFDLKIYSESDKNYVIFVPKLQNDELAKLSYNPAVFGDSETLKLAQSAILITGEERNTVYNGIIQSLINFKETGKTEESKRVSKFTVSIPEKQIYSGIPVINLNGEIIGMRSNLDDGNTYIAINTVKSALASTSLSIANSLKAR